MQRKTAKSHWCPNEEESGRSAVKNLRLTLLTLVARRRRLDHSPQNLSCNL